MNARDVYWDGGRTAGRLAPAPVDGQWWRSLRDTLRDRTARLRREAPRRATGDATHGVPTGLLLLVLCIDAGAPHAASASPWDGDYFPNVPLTTQHGETVRFFDDLIEGKVVVINFIYTSCVDTCPLETAHLVKVAEILGDRVGRDVFFYSITIDPETDTPEVLAEYARRYGAKWTFLTGEAEDITLLRRKLGLYIEAIQDGSGNHNVSMIIGNQTSGQWRKSSPFENAYVAADKIGRWLTGWKRRADGGDYAAAPALRRVSRGEQLYRSRCSGCHRIPGGAIGDETAHETIGPELAGVTRRRERGWLVEWLRAPDEMIAKGDPIALALLEKYDGVSMPNLRLNQVDVMALIDYLDAQEAETDTRAADGAGGLDVGHAGHEHARHARQAQSRVRLDVTDARVRAVGGDERATAGYATFVNEGRKPATIVALESPAFERVEMHEPAARDEAGMMRRITSLAIEADDSVSFSPGGKHLMLIGPRRSLEAGETIGLTVSFASGRDRVVPFRVVEAIGH